MKDDQIWLTLSPIRTLTKLLRAVVFVLPGSIIANGTFSIIQCCTGFDTVAFVPVVLADHEKRITFFVYVSTTEHAFP